MGPFSDRQKLAEIEREIKWRRIVYPRRVDEGSMSRNAAARQIAIMHEIAEDYRARVSQQLELI